MSATFYVMCFIACLMLLTGIISTRRLWEAPTWVGFIFVALMIPQAIYIERSGAGEILDAWYAWLYISGCLLTFWLGFGIAKRRQFYFSIMKPEVVVSDSTLFWRALIVLALGALSLSKVNELAAADEQGSQWTGVITFYYLLFQCIFLAFSVASVRWLSTRSNLWLAVGLVALFFALVAIGANAKRSLTAEVFFVLGVSFFFLRGLSLPRPVIVGLMLFGTVLVHQVGPIRAYIEEGSGSAFDAVVAGVPFEQFAYFNLNKAPELTQGLVDIYRADEYGILDGPAFLWNKMVHQYVPAFLFGREFKEGLKVELDGDYTDGLDRYDWRGATRTGFSDSYTGYSFYGVLIFLLLGLIMGALYAHSMAGAQWALFLYPVLLNDAMFSITESTARFFSGGLFPVLIALFLFWRSSYYPVKGNACSDVAV